MFNSREYEFADIKVMLLGKELSGLRGLTYKESIEKEHLYAQGSKPHSIQRGNEKLEGSLSLLKSDVDDLNVAALAAGYSSILKVPGKDINITCVYQRDGEPGIKSDTLFGCEFTELEDGQKQGDKFKEITLPFLFLRIKRT